MGEQQERAGAVLPLELGGTSARAAAPVALQALEGLEMGHRANHFPPTSSPAANASTSLSPEPSSAIATCSWPPGRPDRPFPGPETLFPGV